MAKELKTLKEYLENYFEKYSPQDRKVMSGIRRKRYEQIRENGFYSNKNGEIFKNEVLKYWAGGYNYKNVWIKDVNENKIPYSDNDDNVLNPGLIREKLENNELILQGSYTLSQMTPRGGDITENMKELGDAVSYLLDDKMDIKERYNKVIKSGIEGHIKGMGHARATMFLHMQDPDQYGIWDNLTEKTFKLLSKVDNRFKIKKSKDGEEYKKIDELLHELKDEDGRFLNLSDVDLFIWHTWYIFLNN